MFDAIEQPTGWTDEKVATLRRLHDEGFSFSHIAASVRMTRNACIGKAARLGLKKPNYQPMRKLPKSKHRFGWDGETIEAVRVLAREGLSQRQIADEMGRRYPDRACLTAGMIAHVCRVYDIKTKGLAPVVEKKAPKPPTITPDIVRHFTGGKRGVKLLDLEPGMCRWPLGDTRSPEFRYCGEPSMRSRPYCCAHTRIATNDDYLNTKQGAALKRELANA